MAVRVDDMCVPMLAQLCVAGFCLLELLQMASCSDLCFSLKIDAPGERAARGTMIFLFYFIGYG